MTAGSSGFCLRPCSIMAKMDDGGVNGPPYTSESSLVSGMMPVKLNGMRQNREDSRKFITETYERKELGLIRFLVTKHISHSA